MSENRLEMRGVTKSYDGVTVLKEADFTLAGGEIHALIGENGAGKSTLMNVLGGVIPSDSGEIRIDGAVVRMRDPSASKEAGVAFIHQELNLVNDLPVYENLFLGDEPLTRFGLVDHAAMIARTKEILAQLRVALSPETMVGELDASYKQVVEIAKAIRLNARILIMDEPTTSLTNVEIENVFAILRTLREKGVGIIFISHKLREVVELCDSYTVLRDGRIVANGRIREENMTENDIARFMVKCEPAASVQTGSATMGEPVLEVSGYASKGHFRDIGFTLRKGEILGFTGLLGDGRTALFQSLFGFRRGASGTVRVSGRPYHARTTTEALRAGVGYVPGNRKENGIIKDFTIRENLTLVALRRFTKRGMLRAALEEACVEKHRAALSIRMESGRNLITSLSGGNQQKIVLAKWMEAGPEVLILDNPTQGVDIGGKCDIYDIIRDMARGGAGVIVLSNEAQEVLQVADRILVMYHGEIAGELSGAQANEENIMILATGGRLEARAGTGTEG